MRTPVTIQTSRIKIHLAAGLLAVLLFSACQASTPAPTADPPETPTPGETATAIQPPSATATPEAPPLPTDTPSPPPQAASYERAPCQFTVPFGQDVDCGYLTVPASRQGVEGVSPLATIRLHVAVFKSRNPEVKPDPVVYLEGGPGGNPLEAAYLVFRRRFAPVVEDRDLVIFDQRGAGLSEPALDCPEVNQADYDIMDKPLSPAEKGERSIEAALACRDRLVAEGISLAVFNSAESAADLNDLRLALGYDAWNLYGVSYGTRLALTAIRDYPDGIRSVILDSAYPLESELYSQSPANADRAFGIFFQGCASDPICSDAFPDLGTAFQETVERLNREPVLISITNPLSGESFDMLVEGDDLIEFLFNALYATELIPLLPQIITELSQSNFETFALIEGSFLVDADYVSRGMHYSVQCYEEVPFARSGDVSAAMKAYPRVIALYEDGLDGRSTFAICDAWGAGRAGQVENQPVQSDIPALIMAGEYDPITPPEWGLQVAENLSSSFFFAFPGSGHGVSFSEACPRAITLSFLEDPQRKPAADCLAEMSSPTFQVSAANIDLIPFSDETFGLSGLIPEGWNEIAPGAYSSGSRAIIQQAGPPGLKADALLEFILVTLRIDEVPDSVASYEANDLTWSLYEIKALGASLDVAVAEDHSRAYIIAMQASPGERDLLRETVFFPIINAFTSLTE